MDAGTGEQQGGRCPFNFGGANMVLHPPQVNKKIIRDGSKYMFREIVVVFCAPIGQSKIQRANSFKQHLVPASLPQAIYINA